MASGNLGLISFPREPGPRDARADRARLPGLLAALRDHPGIGFVLVRSERTARSASARGGVDYLDDDRVEGEDPLAPFGPHAAAPRARAPTASRTARTSSSTAPTGTTIDEVAAFEELVGSHGGMGGGQSHPFVLHPRARAARPEPRSSAPRPCTATSGAGSSQLGHPEYGPEGAQAAEGVTSGSP